MTSTIDIKHMMSVLTKRTVSFFEEELGIPITPHSFALEDVRKLTLKHLTSIISVGGNIEMYLAFSFDQGLIERAFEHYSEDLDISEEEKGEYIAETAGDIINIIIGNTVGEIQEEGPLVNLSPPIIISEAKSVLRHKHAQFYSALLTTDHGNMNIHCIGPKELFDPSLNYIEGGSDA